MRVISPNTFAWILQQMNPMDAARLSARLGSRMISRVLNQVHAREAMDTLLRLPNRQAWSVAGTLEQPLPDPELLEHSRHTAGALVIIQFPTVREGDLAEAALDNLRELERTRYQFTHVFVLAEGGELAGQVNMVDLALSRNETPVREIVEPVLATVAVSTPSEECARLRRHYNVTQLPVVEEGRLIGVIPAE